jgi:hypothetical protein
VGLLTNFWSLPVRTSFGPFWRTLVACFLVGWHFETQAAATITFSQVGNDVQATIGGSLDLTGLIAGTTTTPNARVRGGGSGANVVIGPAAGASTKFYSTITGPTYIGCSTDTIDASSGIANPSGMFGINMAAPARLLVPQNYNSGGNVSASSTWNGATISSLGLTSGTYVFTWGVDTLTIIIPSGGASCVTAQAVPSLSEWKQLMLGLMVMTVIGWHFHRERNY